MNDTKPLIDEERYDYKCFEELKRLLNDEKYKEIIIKGYLDGKISGFDKEMWNKIHSQNIRRIDNFEDVFKDGMNIGYCTVCSKQLSYSFDNCYICGGVLPLLKGTTNSIDGSHTWIEKDGKIIDTTLMLIIDKSLSKELGYIEENRYNPNNDPIYRSAKDFATDINLKSK